MIDAQEAVANGSAIGSIVSDSGKRWGGVACPGGA
jgi:hypothetical protein